MSTQTSDTIAVLDRTEPDRASEPDLGPEFAVLRLGSDPDLAGLLPRMRFDLRDTPSVVTDVVDGQVVGDLALEPEVAAAIGGAIGAWHRGSEREAERFGPATVNLAPAAWALLDIAGGPLLRASLGALRREWSATTVIHGDCRLDRAVLTSEPDGCGGARVVLTGWGRSGTGDPAWDLGGLLAELFVAALRRGAASGAEPAISALLAAYGRATGSPERGDGFARRVVLSVVARLVADAHEGVEGRSLLTLARSVAAWLPNWTVRFERWLGVPAHEHDAWSAAEHRSRTMHPAGPDA